MMYDDWLIVLTSPKVKQMAERELEEHLQKKAKKGKELLTGITKMPGEWNYYKFNAPKETVARLSMIFTTLKFTLSGERTCVQIDEKGKIC